ncbi:response regulator transcription factor [Lysinibacillus piscis]|uniref:HTH luxR-type domain-containing protein n=1 Tax=Lysinibacillus piscis TaxID=2518931 RepID=A0ABQ5NNZ3_9BACI|nr:helix-turn-helix transcriptional regulator [Lysinibacillus sp. KH24]GLC89719.1 hypothetical protein LYSBPC_28460 [Lysinibacillus sp. KH24]
MSTTELKILHQITEDKTNGMISEELGVSQRTVERHISSILCKLKVDSRVGAAVKALYDGLVVFSKK